MTLSEDIADFVVNTNIDLMPPELTSIAKGAIIDTFGVAFAGSVNPGGRAILAFAENLGAKPSASIISGARLRTAAPVAALVNGAIAHVLDYDDVGAGTQGHPSAVILPVVFALGEEIHSSGREVIEAYILGVEVWAKISGMMPQLHMKGWHPSGVLGTIGAVAAAAKILKLDIEQTTMAFGIAGSLASGLLQNFGSTTKSIHVGNAAWNGVMAAQLALKGCSAADDIFEGTAGLLATFGGAQCQDLAKVSQCLGNPYALLSPGLTKKKYPTCASTHRAIDAMLDLVNTHDISPGDAETITCHSHPAAINILFHNNPGNALEAKFSMQYALAVSLAERRFGLTQCSEKYVTDPSIRQLMSRVVSQVHPDWQKESDTQYNRPDRVTIKLKGGTEYSREVLIPHGDPQNPLSEQELLVKYHECACVALTKKEVERRLAAYRDIESVPDISQMMQ